MLRRLSFAFSIKIRTSEDVRDSKKVKVWFYVLSQSSFLTRAKPRKGIPCGKTLLFDSNDGFLFLQCYLFRLGFSKIVRDFLYRPTCPQSGRLENNKDFWLCFGPGIPLNHAPDFSKKNYHHSFFGNYKLLPLILAATELDNIDTFVA